MDSWCWWVLRKEVRKVDCVHLMQFIHSAAWSIFFLILSYHLCSGQFLRTNLSLDMMFQQVTWVVEEVLLDWTVQRGDLSEHDSCDFFWRPDWDLWLCGQNCLLGIVWVSSFIFWESLVHWLDAESYFQADCFEVWVFKTPFCWYLRSPLCWWC